MKISPGQVSNVMNSYRKQLQSGDKVKGSEFKASLKNADQTKLSDEAKLYQAAMKALKKIPDVREDKVAEVKKAIESGTYQVSGKEIADKIIERIQVDKLV